jgi:hypothetical protein
VCPRNGMWYPTSGLLRTLGVTSLNVCPWSGMRCLTSTPTVCTSSQLLYIHLVVLTDLVCIHWCQRCQDKLFMVQGTPCGMVMVATHQVGLVWSMTQMVRCDIITACRMLLLNCPGFQINNYVGDAKCYTIFRPAAKALELERGRRSMA